MPKPILIGSAARAVKAPAPASTRVTAMAAIRAHVSGRLQGVIASSLSARRMARRSFAAQTAPGPRGCQGRAWISMGGPEAGPMRIVALLVVLALATPVTPALGAPEGTLTWGLHVTLAAKWLDPSDTEAFINPFMVLYAVHDALVKPMPGGDNTPSLAESWSASKDGLTYEFVLRRGVKFHNGDPVTAEDVKFSFDRYRGAAAKVLKERVREVQIVDPGRVRFQLKEPWPDFMTFYGTSATGAAWIVPKRYVEKVGDDGFLKAPIGAGPYRVVSFTPGIDLVMEAFEGYWRKTPSVKRLVFRSMPDETTRAAALKAGDVDIVYLLSGPTAADVKRTPGLRLVAAKPPGVPYLDLPEQWDPKSPWHDRRVRLAASHAIDREGLNQAETLGLSRPTGGLIPRVLDFAKVYEPPPYDAARAKQLLAEAGYPNGFDAGDLTPFPPFFSMGEALVNYLQAVGIRTRMRTMERAAFLSAWREKKLRGVIMGLGAPAGNAATRIEVYVTKSGIYSSGVVPEIEDLFARQARELDRKKREAMLHQIQQIMHDRVLHVPIYELAFLWGVGPRVEEAMVDAIKGFSYSAPYEDLKVRAR
ncbi:MAG: hypothetical protein DMD78_05055 [Candidatus Rokuibacteriota bacterium]|nr:MAG: hypothetical protein DMD78_05055 [Candidatus Rokubacteria bacterium]